jgi:hypothetical protein
MATITWTIDSMSASTTDINGHPEVVLIAIWRCTGVQGEYSSTMFSICSFAEPSVGGSFTPYADLTQDQVVGWCWASGVNKSEVEATIQADIDNQINPPVVTLPLPWAGA